MVMQHAQASMAFPFEENAMIANHPARRRSDAAPDRVPAYAPALRSPAKRVPSAGLSWTVRCADVCVRAVLVVMVLAALALFLVAQVLGRLRGSDA
jgi:hypothetical protein